MLDSPDQWRREGFSTNPDRQLLIRTPKFPEKSRDGLAVSEQDQTQMHLSNGPPTLETYKERVKISQKKRPKLDIQIDLNDIFSNVLFNDELRSVPTFLSCLGYEHAIKIGIIIFCSFLEEEKRLNTCPHFSFYFVLAWIQSLLNYKKKEKKKTWQFNDAETYVSILRFPWNFFRGKEKKEIICPTIREPHGIK